MTTTIRLTALTLAALLSSGAADAALVQIGTASGLSGTDATLFFATTRATAGQPIGKQYSGSAGGNTLTFTASSESFEIDIVGYNYGDSAFANGTNILGAGAFQGSAAPVTITFAMGVSEFGFGAEDFDFNTYQVNFSAYSGASLLGSFSANGSVPNSLAFVGARATAGEKITRLVVSSTSNDVSIGPVSFGVAVSAVPEPTTVPLMLTSMAVGALVIRRRKDRTG